MPNFTHRFEPASADPVGATCTLSTVEIENAGLLEILQTPGAPVGHWGLFDPLLDPGNPDFVFRETLGKSREVKTAISGLFGRFVARAYARRYLNFAYFTHIHSPPLRLNGVSRAWIIRRPRHRGDLPDWAVWSPRSGMGIIEAKGTHAPAGPGRILQSAYRQAERAEIQIGGRRARFKRYAIATRWGFLTGSNPYEPILAVKDPVEEGEDVSETELEQIGIGIARRHMASLLRPLGQVELASALEDLVQAPFRNREAAARSADEPADWIVGAGFQIACIGLGPSRMFGGPGTGEFVRPVLKSALVQAMRNKGLDDGVRVRRWGVDVVREVLLQRRPAVCRRRGNG